MEAIQNLKNVLRNDHVSWLSLLWRRSQFGGMPLSAPPAPPEQLLSKDGELVYELFVRGEAVNCRIAERVLGVAFLTRFLELGLLAGVGETLRSTGLRLRSELGFNLLAGSIPSGGDKPETIVHFGQDSLILAEVITSHPSVRNALDLCAGGGMQSLCLARVAERVTAVEYVPLIAEVARVNVALAGVEDRIEVKVGDLFNAVDREPFDLIVCNPPFAPSLDRPSEDRVGAGGIDGLDVVRAVWRGAPARLAENGRLFIITGMLGDENGPFAEEEMRRISLENRWQMHFLGISEPTPVDRVQVSSLISEDRVERRVQQKVDAALLIGATHYHLGLITASPSSSPSYRRAPAYAARAPQMRRSIDALRKIRKRA